RYQALQRCTLFVEVSPPGTSHPASFLPKETAAANTDDHMFRVAFRMSGDGWAECNCLPTTGRGSRDQLPERQEKMTAGPFVEHKLREIVVLHEGTGGQVPIDYQAP
ncbi:hypothetical protein HDU85_005961, partial [Gaertneriomyces sp. JEL0708]